MSDSRHYYGSSSGTGSSEAAYLGFANLPNQVHRKSAKKGYEFVLICVGESGLGKSTLIQSLFSQSQLYRNRKLPIANLEAPPKTVEINANQVEIEERGVKLKLTVVDTPGFGDALDNRDCIPPIVDYIDEQYERFLEYESGLNRKHITDTRVHCCFYFISPIGHGLRPIDIEFMKQLHQKVNIVPIISKADIFTKDELSRLKKRILSELQTHRIQVYSIPDCDSDEEQEYKEQVKQLRAAMPFAVCASLDALDGVRKTHGRQYNWGTVVMENPSHCDFVQLRQFLVTHMQDLRELTNELHYENYRCTKLASRAGGIGSGAVSESECGPSSLNEQQKDRILQEKEEELRKMQQMIINMQKQMSQQQQLSSN